jgi:hypothetical protein
MNQTMNNPDLKEMDRPCGPESRFHDLRCQHRIKTRQHESCGANCVTRTTLAQVQRSRQLLETFSNPGSRLIFFNGYERESELSLSYASLQSETLDMDVDTRLAEAVSSPSDPKTAIKHSDSQTPFICPLCLTLQLNINVALDAKKAAGRDFALEKSAGLDVTRKMAQGMIDRRVKEGGRVCKEATKTYSAQEQMLEDFMSDVPEMLKTHRALGVENTRETSFAPYISPKERPREGAKTRLDAWKYQTMRSGHWRDRSRSPGLEDRIKHTARECYYPAPPSPSVSWVDVDSITERTDDARVGNNEEAPFARTVREYLEELTSKRAEDDKEATYQ